MFLQKPLKRLRFWLALGCVCAAAHTVCAGEVKLGDFKLGKFAGFLVLDAREEAPYVVVGVDNTQRLPLHVDKIRAWIIMKNGDILIPQDRHPAPGYPPIYSGNGVGRTEQITFIFKSFGKPDPEISAVLLQFYEQYQVFSLRSDSRMPGP